MWRPRETVGGVSRIIFSLQQYKLNRISGSGHRNVVETEGVCWLSFNTVPITTCKFECVQPVLMIIHCQAQGGTEIRSFHNTAKYTLSLLH